MTRRLLMGIASVLLFSGCQLYRVDDTATGRQYLTSTWQMYQDPWRDTLELHDLRTGQDVTIREYYQIERLTEIEAVHSLHDR